MKTKKIDGKLFAAMLENGMRCLSASEKELNAMNVFPVADGDTGTNMLTTLKNGIRVAPDTEDLSEYLNALSGGMLLGARGNSGVILSQIFKGISLELSRRAAAAPMDLRNALIRAYRVAYEAVIHPQEGTILTVCREGIEQVARQMRSIPDVETLLRAYLSYMEISLSKTPELLPVLAEMGVLDSGASGYIAIIRGMADWLDGITHDGAPEPAVDLSALSTGAAPDFSAFTADSTFEEGYCMEFILQLLRSVPYLQDFEEQRFIRALEKMGNSLVVVRDGTRVKVHVHTVRPAPVISYAQQYGEFLTFKLENMQLQHNEYLKEKEPQTLPAPEEKQRERVMMASVAAVNGDGLRDVFQNLGCREIIACGPTMNASAEEFVRAIRAANAEHTVILPGNPNLILAAQQAAGLAGGDVRVLEAKTVPEAYFALAMDLQDSEDAERRIEQMQSGIESVDTLLIAVAAKTFSHNGTDFPKHQWVAIAHGEPVLSADSQLSAILQGIDRVGGLSDKEICVLFRGRDGDASLEDEIREALEERCPLMDITFLDGGQQIYDWMIGLA